MPIQTALTPSKYNRPSMRDRMQDFDEFIKKKSGDSSIPPLQDKNTEPYPESDVNSREPVIDDVYKPYEGLYGEGSSTLPEIDDITKYDLYIAVDAEVMLPKDGQHMQAARVIRPSKDEDGKRIGTFSQNPILNTTVYDVMFPDGTVTPYAANIIAENIYSQVDEDGLRYQLIDHIVGHRKDGKAVPMSEAFTISKNGNKICRQTIKGWEFKVLWKDGIESWVPLRELKESHPVQVAEYAVTAEMAEKPAFAWWVPHTIKKRDRIISKVVSRLKKKTHKYGIEVHRDMQNTLELDKQNGNTL